MTDRARVNRVPLVVFRTRWERRLWLPRGWVFTVSVARREDEDGRQ